MGNVECVQRAKRLVGERWSKGRTNEEAKRIVTLYSAQFTQGYITIYH